MKKRDSVFRSVFAPVLVLGVLIGPPAFAQLYVETVGGVFPLNICTCTLGPNSANIGTGAIGVAPNQTLHLLAGNQLLGFNPANGSVTTLAPIPNGGNSLVTAANGLVYVLGTNASGLDASLSVSNPATGITTNLGTLPAGFFPSGDLFFYNGDLYGTVEINGANCIAEIPINNPAATTPTLCFANLNGMQGAASLIVNGVETVYVSTYDANIGVEGIYQLDMVTGVTTLVCPVSQVTDLGALTGSTATGCCNNFAGTFAQTSLVNFCLNQPAALTHNGNQVLNAGSALSFVLTTSNAATLPTGLLQVSSTPSFTFDPATMSLNTTYYVAAVAAPVVSGTPVWTDPCLRVSAYVPVRWRPLPSVSFTLGDPSLCSGSCESLNVSLTGTPPFSLSYSTPAGSFSQNFASTSGSMLVCAPAGTPSGPFEVLALGVTDAFCTCN